MGYRKVKAFVTNRQLFLFTPRLYHTLLRLTPTFMLYKGRYSAPKKLTDIKGPSGISYLQVMCRRGVGESCHCQVSHCLHHMASQDGEIQENRGVRGYGTRSTEK